MIPFHKIYAWLFKSFSIGEEHKIVERLIEQGYTRMMIIKRSWVFILTICWIPIVILILSGLSIWLALFSIEIVWIRWVIVLGNILMSIILLGSSLVYWWHFKQTYQNTDTIIEDIPTFKEKLTDGDRHFISFFNWSITNQWLLGLIIILEIIFVIIHLKNLNFGDNHFWFIILDFVVIFAEMYYLNKYRKHMIDLEMDFNVVVQGKMFFINQSGVLSNTQTLESDKIKTIKSTFPNALASFFNFGNIDILTEGDQGSLGAMQMFYVTSPAKVVNSIQTLLGEKRSMTPKQREELEKKQAKPVVEVVLENSIPPMTKAQKIDEVSSHTRDIRGKVRDIL